MNNILQTAELVRKGCPIHLLLRRTGAVLKLLGGASGDRGGVGDPDHNFVVLRIPFVSCISAIAQIIISCSYSFATPTESLRGGSW